MDTIANLVKYKANIDEMDINQNTALHLAVQEGHKEAALHLIEHKANINVKDISNTTALHWASCLENSEILIHLIGQKANINAQNTGRLTPLHHAAYHALPSIATLLIHHKANIESRDIENHTPLHLAARHGRAASIKCLIKHQANIEAKDSNQVTALHMATLGDHIETILCLLTLKANIESHNKKQATPLLWATKLIHIKALLCLLEHKANIHAQNSKGITPLHKASESGDKQMTQILIDHKADLAALTKKKYTPLHTAIYCHHLNIVSCLINQPHFCGKNWLSINKGDHKALFYTIKNPMMLNELIIHPNCPLAVSMSVSQLGDNLLHLAVKEQCIPTIYILLQHPTLGISLSHQKNKKELTPLDEALLTKNNRIIDLLKFFNHCLRNLAKDNPLKSHAQQDVLDHAYDNGWTYLLAAHMDKIRKKSIWLLFITQSMAYHQNVTLKDIANQIKNRQELHNIVKEDLLDAALNTNNDWILARTLQFPTPGFVKTTNLELLKYRITTACQTFFSPLSNWLTHINLLKPKWNNHSSNGAYKSNTSLHPFNTQIENTAWETNIAKFLTKRPLSSLALTSRYYYHRFCPDNKLEQALALFTYPQKVRNDLPKNKKPKIEKK